MKTGKRMTKKVLQKAKRVIAKQTKSKAKKNMDTFFFQAKCSTTLIPSQGALVSNYVYRQFALMDSTSSTGVTQIPEFKLYASLYDQVRINSVHVRFIPKANVLDAWNAQADDAVNVSGSGMYYTAIDRDGPAPSNVSAILRYPSVRKTSVLKKSSRQYSIKWPTGLWLDCQNIFSEQDVLQRQGCFGGITIYAESLLEDNLEVFNEPFCDVEISYNCVFRGKTSASIGFTESGALTITPHDSIVNLEQTPLGVGGRERNVVALEDGTLVSTSDRGDHDQGPTGPVS